MSRLGECLPKNEYTKQISMLWVFTNVIASVGSVFAALHVLIGFITFQGEVDPATGDKPKFFDDEVYVFYLILTVMFACAPLVAYLFRRLPALALIPSMATVTYLMVLFDEDLLKAGPMTFLIFSIFVFVGYSAVTLYQDRLSGRSTYRYVICLLGLLAVLLTVSVYFRAAPAAEELMGTARPDEIVEGKDAVRAFERLTRLAKVYETSTQKAYLEVGLAALASILLTLIFPEARLIGRGVSLFAMVYSVIRFGGDRLLYYPMFYLVPLFCYYLGLQIYLSHGGAEAGKASMVLCEESKDDVPANGECGETEEKEA